MKPGEDNATRADDAPRGPSSGARDGTTGLPWLRTWRGVYLFVFGCFIVYVVFLTVLTHAFS